MGHQQQSSVKALSAQLCGFLLSQFHHFLFFTSLGNSQKRRIFASLFWQLSPLHVEMRRLDLLSIGTSLGFLGVTLGLGPHAHCLVLPCFHHLLCKCDHPLHLTLKSSRQQFPIQNWHNMKIASGKNDLTEEVSLSCDVDK